MPKVAGRSRRFDLRRIRGVVFDCDGVLFDSRDVNRHYYNHILLALGLVPMSVEDEDYVFMHTVDTSLARIIPSELMQRAAAVQGRPAAPWARAV